MSEASAELSGCARVASISERATPPARGGVREQELEVSSLGLGAVSLVVSERIGLGGRQLARRASSASRACLGLGSGLGLGLGSGFRVRVRV